MFPPTVLEAFLFSTSPQAFIVCRYFDDDNSDWLRWYLIVVLICISVIVMLEIISHVCWLYWWCLLRRNICSFQFSRSVMFNSLWPHGLQHARPPCCIINSQSLLKLKSIMLVRPSNHLILCHPLLLSLSIFPSIRVFYSESVLCIRWPKYWNFGFNICLANGYSGLISFRIETSCSPRDSQESSPTSQFKSINSLALSFLYSPIVTYIRDY